MGKKRKHKPAVELKLHVQEWEGRGQAKETERDLVRGTRRQ